jgi:hypothetical protein
MSQTQEDAAGDPRAAWSCSSSKSNIVIVVKAPQAFRRRFRSTAADNMRKMEVG